MAPRRLVCDETVARLAQSPEPTARWIALAVLAGRSHTDPDVIRAHDDVVVCPDDVRVGVGPAREHGECDPAGRGLGRLRQASHGLVADQPARGHDSSYGTGPNRAAVQTGPPVTGAGTAVTPRTTRSIESWAARRRATSATRARRLWA